MGEEPTRWLLVGIARVFEQLFLLTNALDRRVLGAMWDALAYGMVITVRDRKSIVLLVVSYESTITGERNLCLVSHGKTAREWMTSIKPVRSGKQRRRTNVVG